MLERYKGEKPVKVRFFFELKLPLKRYFGNSLSEWLQRQKAIIKVEISQSNNTNSS